MTIKVNTVHFDFTSCFLKKDTIHQKSLDRAIALVHKINPTKIKLIVDNLDKEYSKKFKKEIMPNLGQVLGKRLDYTPVMIGDLFSKVSFMIPKEQLHGLTELYKTYAKEYPKVLEGIYQMYSTYGLLPKSGVSYFVSNVFDTETLYRVGNLDVICMRL